MLFIGFPECGAVGMCLNVLWKRVPEKGRAIEKGFPVTGSACLSEFVSALVFFFFFFFFFSE